MVEYGKPHIETTQTIIFLFLSDSVLFLIEFGLGRALYIPIISGLSGDH